MTKILTTFICEICEDVYETVMEAEACETRKTDKPKYKIGDTLEVTTGEGAGKLAVVTRVFYYGPSWHGEEYAHVVGYNADFVDGMGSRQLIQGESCR